MIGLIDSGIGGLGVLAELEILFPHESFLYLCDFQNFPYGKKSRKEIQRCLSKAIAFLLSKGSTFIILACHSASVSIDEKWKRNFPVQIIDMVEPTCRSLFQGKMGLIGTEATLQSGVYQKIIPKLTCVECPSLAEKIQQQSPDLQKTIRHYLHPFTGKNFDGIILACTHYFFAYHEIEEELDFSTRLLNPSFEVAKMTLELFQSPQLTPSSPKHTLFVSKNSAPIIPFLKKRPFQAPFTFIHI